MRKWKEFFKDEKKSKKEIQKELKEYLLDFIKDIQKNEYFIDDIDIEYDVIEAGVDKDGCLMHKDLGGRTMTIRYSEKVKDGQR
jgi:hypothetical protein